MIHELVCIVCPRGCHLKLDDSTMEVTGNSCPRGAAYAKQEAVDPRRTLTSTVRCNSTLLRVCPVKTSSDIRKDKIFDVMKAVNETVVSVPIQMGQVLVKNIADSGADLIATREILN